MHEGRSAVVLALNLKALVRLARDADGVIDFVPRVGDFVASAEPLFRLSGGAATLSDGTLRAQVAFGPERTMEQDATFAFRVIVDVAVKALSQAINDPTTAVLALDQLHRLLRVVGRRHLHDDSLYDDRGALRLILPTPNWDDFVDLAFSEIRLYGASNFQVTRRLYSIRRPDERPSGDEASRTAPTTFRTERYTRAAASPAGGPDARPYSRPAGAGWILNTI